MSTLLQFDRDHLARWYAREHLKTDPAIREVWYLPSGADEREIRLIEINDLIGDVHDSYLEPVDFGIDLDKPSQHTLTVLDVTPEQWDRIQARTLPLPQNWTLDGAELLS